MKAVVAPDDTAPHGVETPTADIPLLAEVREASGSPSIGGKEVQLVKLP